MGMVGNGSLNLRLDNIVGTMSAMGGPQISRTHVTCHFESFLLQVSRRLQGRIQEGCEETALPPHVHPSIYPQFPAECSVQLKELDYRHRRHLKS